MFILFMGGGGIWYWWASGPPPIQYKTALVEREPITAIVTATGTINPVVSVQVGSQVSGKIAKLYADFNSVVREGQILVAGGRRIGAQAGLVAGHRAAHAQARVGVDVVGADQALGQLVEDVVVLGQQLAAEVQAHGVGAMGLHDAGDAVVERGRGQPGLRHRAVAIERKMRGWNRHGPPTADTASVYTEPFLNAFHIQYYLVEHSSDAPRISVAFEEAKKTRRPVAILVGDEYHGFNR